MTNIEPTHFAFWNYDCFPFCVSSVVHTVSVMDNCKVRAYSPSYGGNITPRHLFADINQGIRIDKKLTALEAEYNKKKVELLNEYKRKALEVAPFLHTFPAYSK